MHKREALSGESALGWQQKSNARHQCKCSEMLVLPQLWGGFLCAFLTVNNCHQALEKSSACFSMNLTAEEPSKITSPLSKCKLDQR